MIPIIAVSNLAMMDIGSLKSRQRQIQQHFIYHLMPKDAARLLTKGLLTSNTGSENDP
ncbi:MAG: hypothetical protein K2I63_01495 [Helicobacter sp.]|nr:hypothetical protein [Helicobacter sp.]